MCEPTQGLTCLCLNGWITTNAKSGVFCDKGAGLADLKGNGANPNSSQLDESSMRQILLIGVPSIVGVIVLFIVLFYVTTYRRRQVANIRKTIIEFPQPQLTIPAEKRVDASIMVPDDSGWTNFEV